MSSSGILPVRPESIDVLEMRSPSSLPYPSEDYPLKFSTVLALLISLFRRRAILPYSRYMSVSDS